ncbi:hypothetical protein GYA49_01945 [Candidatus Beckwithbacteria bacterium]|nr:hypothetical protein [Candidatus Beckwithbacteria bacterium]
MKIYFTASISQGKDLEENYKKICQTIKKLGHTLYGEDILDDIKLYANKVRDPKERKKWYTVAMKSINLADVVVVEISYPSTANVGHELTTALEKSKPVVALYREDREPAFLEGIKNDRLFLVPYEEHDLEKELKYALEEATNQMDVRFNFFVSPKIVNYLDWIAKKKKMPRAVYLRRLIEEDMRIDREFEKEK